MQNIFLKNNPILNPHQLKDKQKLNVSIKPIWILIQRKEIQKFYELKLSKETEPMLIQWQAKNIYTKYIF